MSLRSHRRWLAEQTTARNQAAKTLAAGALQDLQAWPREPLETGMEADKAVEEQEQDGAEDETKQGSGGGGER